MLGLLLPLSLPCQIPTVGLRWAGQMRHAYRSVLVPIGAGADTVARPIIAGHVEMETPNSQQTAISVARKAKPRDLQMMRTPMCVCCILQPMQGARGVGRTRLGRCVSFACRRNSCTTGASVRLLGRDGLGGQLQPQDGRANLHYKTRPAGGPIWRAGE